MILGLPCKAQSEILENNPPDSEEKYTGRGISNR